MTSTIISMWQWRGDLSPRVDQGVTKNAFCGINCVQAQWKTTYVQYHSVPTGLCTLFHCSPSLFGITVYYLMHLMVIRHLNIYSVFIHLLLWKKYDIDEDTDQWHIQCTSGNIISLYWWIVYTDSGKQRYLDCLNKTCVHMIFTQHLQL